MPALPPDIEALLGPTSFGDQVAAPPSALVPADGGRELASATIEGGIGGAYDGASRASNQLMMWSPAIKSADADIIPAKHLSDSRVRDTLRNDSYAAAGANLHRDNIVGSIFLLNSKPGLRTLGKGFDETWEQEFQEEVEEKFTLWAESPDKWVDASRINGLTGLVRLAVGIMVSTGEVLASVEWLRDFGRPFNTSIQMIDLDRLSNPPGVPNGVNRQTGLRTVGGVEQNMFGAPQAYWVRKAHPSDWYNSDSYQWKRIDVRKPWGRLQMIHIYEQTRPDQSRGISEMVTALKESRIAKQYRDIELQNAVVNATYAASIESELPSEAVFQAMGGGNIDSEKIQEAITNYASGYLGSIAEYIGSAKTMQIDGAKIPHFFPGTKLHLQPAGKGGSRGTQFEQSVLRYIAAALGVSYEQLSRDYTQTNYSSARAAMNETWKFMQSRKKLVADGFATIVYRLWLEEAINKGLIDSMPRKPVGWLYEGQNLDALAACDWIGAGRGQIDELKETEAAALKIEKRLSTYEREMAKMHGADWRRDFRQAKREQQMLTSMEIQPVASTAAAGAASARHDLPNSNDARSPAHE